MLKFLDQRKNQVPYRSPKKYMPEMVYGISCETPAEFQHPHTILFDGSYVNPYLELEPKRKSIVGTEKLARLNPAQFTKPNPIYVEEHRVIGKPKPEDSVEDKFRHTYAKELQQSPSRFRMTRGPFLDYVQKNHRYQSVGPLLGKQRSNDSMLQTRTKLYEKSRQSLYERTQSTTKSSESMISRNSHLFSKTTKIREERNRFNSEVRQLLDQRKTSDRFAITGYFPNIGAAQRVSRQNSKEHNDLDSIAEQQKDYEEFDRKLQKRFK